LKRLRNRTIDRRLIAIISYNARLKNELNMHKKTGFDTAAQSTTQRAYIALREAIITGKIAPGEKLKVEELKGTLNTGASPVREALSLLTSNQLVERRDQRGFRVALASKKQFNEVLSLRCQLEDLALRASIKQGDQEWEERLVLAHHHMTKLYEGAQDTFEIQHKTFHQLYDLNVRYRYLALKSTSYAKRDVAGEHQAILNAAIERKFEAASRLLVAHYRNTGDYLAELMDLS